MISAEYTITDLNKLIYNFAFDYLKKKYVKVSSKNITTGVVTNYTYGVHYVVVDKTIELLQSVGAVDDVLRIVRETSTSEQIVSWNDASILKAIDMSLAQLQQLHILEEYGEYISTFSLTLDVNGQYNAKNSRIVNLAAPQTATDAVNRGYIDSFIGTLTDAQISASLAQSWSVGDILNRPEGSSKYWAEQAKNYIDDYYGFNKNVLLESTGYGVIRGGNVTVSNMTATVNKLIAHMPDGKRYEKAQTTITIQTADATNPRIDLIYLSDAGVVTYLAGTALSTPTAPTLPSGGLSLATIRVMANATTGTVTDKRIFKPRYQNAGIVNIKDFGAIGDGVTDDTYAIQAAIKYAESLAIPGTGVNGHLITYNGESLQVYFPAGNYLISSTIVISVPHISLVGTPYAQPYGIQPSYTEIGGSNLIKASTFTGTSMVRMNGQYCSAHFLHLIGIPNQTVTRTVKGFESTYGGHSFIRCFVYGCTYGYDVAGGIVRLEFCTSNYNLIGVKIHGDSRIVECEISMSGLKLTGAPNEMSTTGIFTALDGTISDPTLAYYYGTGVWIDGNGANSQIIGGLIEWNRIGIWSDGASGTIVNGTRFDHNSDNHIIMFMRPDSTASGLGFNISGCRFLAGGFLATKTGSNYSAITITDSSDSGRKGFGNISSNTFRLGNWSPGENSDTVTDSDKTAGPRIYAIVIQCNSYVDINVASNDMSQCSLYGTARINAWGGKVNIGRFNSNKSNKPVDTSNNNSICLFNGASFLYGRPAYTPVDSAYDKFPTSRNNDANVAAWESYEYRSGIWYGRNQRSIPDRTANPTVLSGQAISNGDIGYIYYHTTLHSLVKYNGTVWIKLTDGTTVA